MTVVTRPSGSSAACRTRCQSSCGGARPRGVCGLGRRHAAQSSARPGALRERASDVTARRAATRPVAEGLPQALAQARPEAARARSPRRRRDRAAHLLDVVDALVARRQVVLEARAAGPPRARPRDRRSRPRRCRGRGDREAAGHEASSSGDARCRWSAARTFDLARCRSTRLIGLADLQSVTDLRSVPALDVAQQDHGALHLGQFVDRLARRRERLARLRGALGSVSQRGSGAAQWSAARVCRRG